MPTFFQNILNILGTAMPTRFLGLIRGYTRNVDGRVFTPGPPLPGEPHVLPIRPVLLLPRRLRVPPPDPQRLWIQRVFGLADKNNVTVPMEIDPPFDAAASGLKEIGNLASWTVSSCKPGCSVEQLRDEDTGLFWQYV